MRSLEDRIEESGNLLEFGHGLWNFAISREIMHNREFGAKELLLVNKKLERKLRRLKMLKRIKDFIVGLFSAPEKVIPQVGYEDTRKPDHTSGNLLPNTALKPLKKASKKAAKKAAKKSSKKSGKR